MRGTWRGFDTCVSKAPTDAPLEGLEKHNGVRTMDIEEEAIMANVQNGSFSQKGTGDSHKADRQVLLPSSETNGRPKVADAICLGEGRRHKLNKVIIDLDMLANALEGEELGESSSGSDG
jgi:hypothetical protein